MFNQHSSWDAVQMQIYFSLPQSLSIFFQEELLPYPLGENLTRPDFLVT